MAEDRFRVRPDKKFRLEDHDPGFTGRFESKEDGKRHLEKGLEKLRDLQEKLYAQDQWAVLLIFQAMDAAGKDSVVEHVMSGVNPQGCQVYSFKQPSSEELDHDFLWRTTRCLPERGRIGVFNRSYYEEVLVVRVHPQILAKQKLPTTLVTDRIWKERYEDIGAFERYLSRNGTVIRKFFLNVSKDEQRQRFLARLDQPEKNWKFAAADVEERRHWDEYMKAYEKMIEATSSDEAPWFVIPADHKWFTRLAVADVIVETLEGLDLHFPEVSEAQRQELQRARALLEGG
ncbi:MAG TPA: polyphosphate kinase 2 family protein [Vicinamibacteria bacterium]|jgi:PPK2 family polyphosphate:nucleotide phosphotransferase|nr:polyphosphate kinase 2 family protein [Vicinamibacteria bacterium]